MSKSLNKKVETIENQIFTLRRLQFMLDKDLASLYQTDTRTLKQSVKRNIEKFPADFMIELDEVDIQSLVSQSVIPSKKYLGGAVPYAFTEQGVAMLASVIKTATAVEISITIIRAFVALRRTIAAAGSLVQRMEGVEKKLLQADEKFERIFTALEQKDTLPKQGIFFNGQIFDAYKFFADLIRKANHSIVLIDNYVDDTTLQFFTKRKKGVSVSIFTQKISKQLELDVSKFNAQYGGLSVKKMTTSHDRFLILDNKELYHIGASLKDLGNKIFGFSKMDTLAMELLAKIKEVENE